MAVFLAFAMGGIRSAKAEEAAHEFRYDRYSGVSVMNQSMAERIMFHRHINAPMVGEQAPDSRIFDVATGETTTLHKIIKDKPMVLLFGSSSCSNLDMYLEYIARIVERFHGTVDFSFVYIREAHPEGGFMPFQIEDGKQKFVPARPDSKSMEERKKLALELQMKTNIRMQAFADGLDDEMAVRWGSWPNRIFVVGRDRKLLYSGGPGPFYFQLTKEGWHTKPHPEMEEEFLRMPFSRVSLEEFLEGVSKPLGPH